MALYGFYDTAERDMFRRLIGVTRVGPKVALSVLSLLTPADVAAAVATQNAAAFARVPGMGKKTAERVLLELREKVAEAAPAAAEGAPAGGDIRAEAVAALVSLGYDGLSASRAVAAGAGGERRGAHHAGAALAGKAVAEGEDHGRQAHQLLHARGRARAEYSLRPHFLAE